MLIIPNFSNKNSFADFKTLLFPHCSFLQGVTVKDREGEGTELAILMRICVFLTQAASRPSRMGEEALAKELFSPLQQYFWTPSPSLSVYPQTKASCKCRSLLFKSCEIVSLSATSIWPSPGTFHGGNWNTGDPVPLFVSRLHHGSKWIKTWL